MGKRYFIRLSYDGTAYHGWQVQPNAMSVQEALERDMGMVLREETKLTGCGRTDTGVHAAEFWAHFNSSREDLDGREDFLHRMNGILPGDIALHQVLAVKPDAHARFDALSRSYEYHIARKKEVFHRPYAHYVFGRLDAEAMQEAAVILIEYSDFTSFSRVDTDVKTNICRVDHAEWEISEDKLVFRITADRFLRNMVRAIVGTLLEIGFGKLDIQGFRDIIESMDRSNAGASVPGKGLFLTNVSYPEDIFI